MKKILAALLILALVAPAMANVSITATDLGNQKLQINATSDSTASIIRGVAVKLTITGGNLASDAAYVAPLSAFNTFVDQAFTTGSGYTIGSGHPIANPTAAGVAAYPTVAPFVYSVSVGYLDQAGAQAGLKNGTFVVATLQLSGIANNGSASVLVEADTLRGGAVVGDALGTVTLPSSAVTVAGPVFYTLAMSAGAGGTVVNNSGSYAAGTVVNLSASANSGFAFSSWTPGTNIANPALATTTITMNANATIVANFTATDSITGTPVVTKTTASPAIATRVNSGRVETFTVTGVTGSSALQYQFNWGDGSALTWVPAAASYTHTYTYGSAGLVKTTPFAYNVTVKARLASNNAIESATSSALALTSEPVKSSLTTIYAAWADFGRPNCWAFQRSCRGDINGVGLGLNANKVWVNSDDLAVFSAAYNRTVVPLKAVLVAGIPGICADNNRVGLGLNANKVWVNSDDLTIFSGYFNKIVGLVPVCDQANYWYWTN